MELSKLPDNVAELKAIIGSLLPLKSEVETLREQVRQLNKLLFAHKSEKWTKEDRLQAFLFNEIEFIAYEPIKKIEVSSHTREKAGRKALSPSIRRIEKIHDLSEEEKICSCGQELRKFATDKREELVYVPAQIFVDVHLYPQYSCPACQGLHDESKPAVKSAEREKQLIPRSFASTGLIAYLWISKFMDHLPLYRLERIFKRLGVDLPRATMSNWFIKISKPLSRLMVVMRSDFRRGVLASADETRYKVMREKGRTDKQLSWMWLFTGGDPDRPVIIYKYSPSRAGPIPLKMLGKDFKGHLMTDGFSSYNGCEKLPGLTLISCWAHVRRKFKDAYDEFKSPLSEKFLTIIQQLYLIERILHEKNAGSAEILKMRTEKSVPLLEKFHLLLIENQIKILEGGPLGKAIDYALKLWPRLIVYVNYGHLPIDNNHTENQVRPFALGRKNWLFSMSPRGAFASSVLYSILQSAIANGLDPYKYLVFLLNRLPHLKSRADFESVAPHRVDKNMFPVKLMA